MDRHVAVAQDASRGGGAHGGPWEVNGVLIQSIDNGAGGPTVAHVHDAKRWLKTAEEVKKKNLKNFGQFVLVIKKDSEYETETDTF